MIPQLMKQYDEDADDDISEAESVGESPSDDHGNATSASVKAFPKEYSV